MESRLQSNEIRIPKHSTSTSSPTSLIIFSTSTNLMGPNSTITNSQSKMENFYLSTAINNTDDGVSSKMNAPTLPEFDLNAPCQYFKSSFARSLSLGSANQTKSLDFGINFGLSRNSPISEEPQTLTTFNIDDIPPPLPSTKPPSLANSQCIGITTDAADGIHGKSNNSKNNKNLKNPAVNNSIANTNSNNVNSKNVWSTSRKQNFNRRSLDSSEIELLRLRKECQNLIEENRRLMGLASGMVRGNLIVPGTSSNIEAVILQTQVDTLQWQLKQVEASREMYRAVMEEVVRFLERCHRNLEFLQNQNHQNNISARPRSIHQVYHNDINITDNESSLNQSSTISSRARSSTNLLDVQKNNCLTLPLKSNGDDIEPTSPAISYNNFRDFTWRRSPKRQHNATLSTSEREPEKLSQEAFRLLRTAQNLLNTQEPDLTQSKAANLDISFVSSSTGTSSAHQNNLPISSSTLKSNSSSNLDSDPFLISSFARKVNMRESRLSLRSSTDSSVHSTSSSKTETDEEIHSNRPQIENLKLNGIRNTADINKESTICSSTTEDESGFSSISSFQEVGLPLHSTMISSSTLILNTNGLNSLSLNESGSDINGETTISLDSRNSTLKASQQSLVNGIGLPSSNHRRWDSAPVVPPRNGVHRFSTVSSNGEDSPTVLWV